MKFLPYKNIKTQNLGIVLFTARFAAVIGYALTALGCLLIICNVVINLMPANPVEVEGTTLNFSSSGYGMIYGGLLAIALALIVFLFSGMCAALVTWEQSRNGCIEKVT